MECARKHFPRGLAQPEGRFRFAADALLLAAFAKPPKGAALAADLGTGCGVVGLALLLAHPEPLRVLGLDADAAMAAAAADNARRLGLAQRFQALALDVARVPSALAAESCGLVLANPPYMRPGQGRASASAARDRALFEDAGGLDAFVGAAAHLARNRAQVCLVWGAERLAALLAGLAARRLEPKRLRLVHSRLDGPARLALVEARKNGGPGLEAEPPLALYQGRGPETRLSAQALDFCPWLACNAGPRGATPDPAP
jgi:tRNA1Val (adenine37-N6)-methyltransferase